MNARRRVAAAALLLLAGCSSSPPPPPPADVGAELAMMVRRFLDGLDDEQRRLACRALDDPEAGRWHFVPGRYPGVEIGALDARQKVVLHGVVQTMLSAVGYQKTMAVVQLENTLREIESAGGRDASHRDPDRYSLLVCGEPDIGGTFVLRFQGHHVSLRVAVVDGIVAGHTPYFLGANPHRLPPPSERRPVLREEEDVARALLDSLDDEQRQRCVIDPAAPPDILLGPGKAPTALGERRGLRYADMTDEQRGLLWRLILVYAEMQRDEVAVEDLERIRTNDLDGLTFAWAGGLARGEKHYYRVHGATFVIEYDNTQNDGNHVHTVWRDFERDFGGDPLRAHLEQQHGR